jgi:predicted dehydrogenase
MKFGQWHDIEVEDDVTAYVEYENGATGVFITTTGDADGTNRFEIQMDKAKLIAEGDSLTVIELDVAEPEFTKTNTAPFGSPKKQEIDPELDGENRQHMGVLAAWAKAVRLGEPLVAGGEEGIHGLTLANAMYLSAWKGQAITLPFDEDEYYEELMKRVATSRRKTNVVAQTADTAGTFAGTK